MASNPTSFSRFTAMPAVVSRYGWTAEEAASTAGKPHSDPVLSPMASPAASEAMLALRPRGSDPLRLGGPPAPKANPYERPKPAFVLSRSMVRKLDGDVIAELQRAVDSGLVSDGNLEVLMQDSLRRVAGLRDLMDRINQMAEGVYLRSLAASKG